MNYLGKRNGYKAVAWRAGCWGERGVQSILRGAFQWVSAHLAVDAVGGRFWQLMLAERAIQGKFMFYLYWLGFFFFLVYISNLLP
jgi:hypothetical protein